MYLLFARDRQRGNNFLLQNAIPDKHLKDLQHLKINMVENPGAFPSQFQLASSTQKQPIWMNPTKRMNRKYKIEQPKGRT